VREVGNADHHVIDAGEHEFPRSSGSMIGSLTCGGIAAT
jgi:hypothetical protein